MDNVDSSAVRLLIVEDHAALGEALLFAFGLEAGIEAIGVAPSVARALDVVAAEQPDAVLMDVRLPDGSGLDAAAEVVALRPGAAVVIMTAHADQDDALRAADAGAAGFVLKNVRIATIAAGVRQAADGAPAIDPALLRSVLTQAATAAANERPLPGELPQLTSNERELIALLAQGCDRAFIAAALGISKSDVAVLTASVQQRLGARSPLEALVRAARIGLLKDRVVNGVAGDDAR